MMANEGRGLLTRVYGHLFPERQIYLRSEGEVRFATFSAKAQLGLVSIGLMVAAWVVFSTFQYVFQNDIIASKNERIRVGQEAYLALESEMRNTQIRFISAAQDLDAKHSQLIALVSQKENLEQRLHIISGRLTVVSDDHLEASEEAAALRTQLQEERSTLSGRIGTLQGQLRSTLDQRSGLEQNLTATRNRVASLSAERDTLIKSNADLTGNLSTVNGRLVDIRGEQQRFIDRIAARTSGDINLLEDTIAMTGLNTATLFEKSGVLNSPMGGPVIDPSIADDRSSENLARLDGSTAFDSSVAGLEDSLQRWETLQSVLRVLPIAAPADNFYISSDYGRRRDPITKRNAFHAGVDLAGPARQPVYATAPGKVVRAAKNGPYGNMVEIDHGFGLRTRYGHLDRITVKKNEEVEFRTQIGRMGSTGRSTGTHLHYEIRFEGKAYDPARFLKAGKYVFKN
ncbi:MAG: peptidoglycan DD-metalloendopeptidase family protein [Alphaproteobacteria bacterium]|nr:peptidoglycan DD-metalloendopeptidase family protein [Alphaproteobacteria bacterium]